MLFDTDLNEEVWVEAAAHHGVIYELKWSRDDRYLLSCSGDGTSKVWDMLSVSYRSSNTMGFGALLHGAAGNNTAAGSSSRGGAVGSGSVDVSSSLNNAQSLLAAASSKPPFLVCTQVASPPVYTYAGVFQDQPRVLSSAAAAAAAAAAGADSFGGSRGKGVGGDNTSASAVPRIITGGADGRLRVWEGAEMVGYVHVLASKDREKDKEKDKVDDKDEAPAVDYSPHEGQVNSIVIDERSR